MNMQQLREIASRHGYVRWLKSGVIEQLVPGRKNKRAVAASGPLTKWHPIFGPAAMEFQCEEVAADTPMERQRVKENISRVRTALRQMARERLRSMIAAGERRKARQEKINVK